MQIPLVDLKAQYVPLREEILATIAEILDGMQLFLGPNLREFEQKFAGYCGAADCVGVANGTEAIELALRACGVGSDPQDEVITVSHSFIATTEGIWAAGASPVFVDIDPRTYTMDVTQVEAEITPRTKAIIPVHMHGQMADMVSLRLIANRHGLVLIEDAAQAHGATFNGKPAGSWGDLACFSFYFSKNLGAYGEAGGVVTSNPELAARLRLLRDHGAKTKYEHSILGFNSRLDEIQAAILKIKLGHLEDWNSARRRHAAYYNRLLADTNLTRPFVAPGNSPVYHHYAITTPHRDALQRWLQDRGIGTAIHYPKPIHLQPACQLYGYGPGSLPVTERYARETLSLPMYAELTAEQIEYVVAAIKDFYQTTAPAFEEEPIPSLRR